MTQFQSQLDDKEQLLRLLGGFWSDTYQGQDFLGEALLARANLTGQTFDRLQEAIDCRSRLDVPLFRKENWRYLSIKKSTVASFPNMYGEAVAYGEGALYGKRSASLPFVYPIDEELFDCKLITNRLSESSVNLVSGLDFIIDENLNVIRLKANPFDNTEFQSQFLDDGDEEVILWMYRPKIDRQYVYQHFGYVIDMWAKTSQEYKDLVNNIYDSLVLGTSVGKTLDAISLATGIPFAKGNETVVDISEDRHNKLVLTDKNVYKLSPRAVVTVSIGDALSVDQSITNALEFFEFNRGIVPESVVGISLFKDLLPGDYLSEIGFKNELTDLIVETTLDGKTKVSFEIGGHPFDVEAFWDDVHNRGLASGKTLANLLDTRVNKEGEPSASNLPKQINPFGFLVQNVLRHGAFIVKVKAEAVDGRAAGIDKLSYAKKLLPPHTTMILIIGMLSIEENVVLEEDEEDEIFSFTGANTLSDSIEENSLQDVIFGRVVTGVLM